jgi:hypothetical protein
VSDAADLPGKSTISSRFSPPGAQTPKNPALLQALCDDRHRAAHSYHDQQR